MKKNEKAKIVVELIRQKTEQISRNYLQACALLTKVKTSHSMWEEQHPENGVGTFSKNPYHIERATAEATACAKKCGIANEVMKYTIEVFLDNL